MSQRPICLFLSNSDISGISLRTAIYAQNLLVLGAAVLAIWDGTITKAEKSFFHRQSSGMLITGFTILLTAIIQAAQRTLSIVEAAIALELVFMNSLHIIVYIVFNLHHHLTDIGTRSGQVTVWKWTRRQLRSTMDGVVCLGCLHLSLMSCVGLWLWSNPTAFGDANTECMAIGRISIFGSSISMTNTVLNALSLAVYSALLIPGFNVLIWAFPFLLLVTKSYTSRKWIHLSLSLTLFIVIATSTVLIIDIELTIRNVQAFDVLVGEESYEISPGPLLALAIPLRDIVESFITRFQPSPAQLHNSTSPDAMPDTNTNIRVSEGADVRPESGDESKTH